MLNPRKTERFIPRTYRVNWETFGLRLCDVILFWIPPQARPMPEHRIYAITTRMELAENLARGHKIIFGVHSECEDLAGIRHLKSMAKYYGVETIHSTLDDCLKELKAWMERPRKAEETVHHMSGLAFGAMEELSHVSTVETNRNLTLMEHWNQTVAPGDTVVLDGDFGAQQWMPFLNGKIELKEK